MANELHTLNVNSVSYPITPTQLYLYGSSNNSNYPLVFASGIGNSTNGSASVKNLYTDTENTIYYNPSANRLTLTGPISTSHASGTWLAGTTTSAALNLTHSGYGAVFSAPLKTGRMSVSTYASSDSKLYFNYFANDTITNGTNSADKQMHWDGPTNTLTVTNLSGNASSATKLQTARSLWGQSFDGTANVSGNISSTGNITPSAGGTYNIGTKANYYERIYGRYIDTNDGYYLRLCAGGTERMTITTENGYIGIGTTGPTQMLDVRGNIVAYNGLLKSTNNGNTVTIGSSNSSWCHFENSADINFYFNKGIHAVGGFTVYNTSYGLASTGALTVKTASVSSTLSVSGTSSFAGKTTHNGGIGTTTIAASSNATVGGTLAVTGTSTFTGHTTHSSGITVPSSQRVNIGSGYITYNGTTGCLEISC